MARRHRHHRHHRYHNWNSHNSQHSNFHHLQHHNFHISSRVSQFLTALLLAILTYFLAANVHNSLFLWLEVGAWIFFAFILYKDVFIWANKVSMANDLAFWGLRILGVGVIFFGLYIGLFTMIASIFVPNSASMSIPITILLGGLVLLGAFIAFRTNRRHNVVGIWRA